MAEVALHGLAQLQQTLKDLPAKLGERVVRGSLRAGAKPIFKQAQANAPVLQKADPRRKAGVVKEAIKVRKSKQQKYGVYVGVKSKKRGIDDPFYWTFQEFGTAHHAAAPFLRPAFESQKYEAIKHFEAYATKRIVKEAEKIAREASMPR